MRKAILILVIAVLAVSGLFAVLHGRFHHGVEVVTYLPDAEGLRRGATVRVSGLDVGRVVDVRLAPDHRENPVEVKMSLAPEYRAHIPNDSKVRLSSAGVLGETYILIDIAAASGPPVSNHAVLKHSEAAELSYDDVLKKLSEALKNVNCDDLSQEKSKVGGKKQ